MLRVVSYAWHQVSDSNPTPGDHLSLPTAYLVKRPVLLGVADAPTTVLLVLLVLLLWSSFTLDMFPLYDACRRV